MQRFGPGISESLACATVDTSGAGFDSFTVLAGRQAGRYGDRPFLTWYDDHRGERIELSFKTFDNWVAKTANLLVDELGAEPGDRVAAVLVDHWQTPIVLAACWRVGVGVVAVDPEADPATAAGLDGGFVAAFVHEQFVAATGAALAGAGATGLVALTADLAGRTEHDLGSALRFARVVPSMGDLFAGGADPQGPALELAGRGTGAGQAATMAQLLGAAAVLAARTGLSDGDRMLSGLGLLTPAGAAWGLLAPFATGAGVVLARAFEPARFWKRVADERVAVAVLAPDQAGSVLAAGPPAADLDRSRLRVVASPAAPESLRTGFQTAFGVPLLDA
jgi:uncharacterized protein (TIGR03089 family)